MTAPQALQGADVHGAVGHHGHRQDAGPYGTHTTGQPVGKTFLLLLFILFSFFYTTVGVNSFKKKKKKEENTSIHHFKVLILPLQHSSPAGQQNINRCLLVTGKR